MKANHKNSLFICQVTDTCFKILECSSLGSNKKEFVGFTTEVIPPGTDYKLIAEKLILALKQMGYSANPVIIALPRLYVTCRLLKVPSSVPEEIERISVLQAPHYLPYPANELIIGYQILQVDKEGYSDINLTIAHNEIIERYVKVFKELRAASIDVVLSSYGLCNLYNYINPQGSPDTVMFADIDARQAELAVISAGKLFFSRAFKLANNLTWQDSFIDEINRTREAYLKGAPKNEPVKIIVSCAEKYQARLLEILNKQSALPVEPLEYKEKIKFSESILTEISNSDNSFAALIGLAVEEIPEPLSLLPTQAKEERKSLAGSRQRLRIFSFVIGIVIIWGIIIARIIDNKAMELVRLKTELNKIAGEVKPLEEIEKRFKILGFQAVKKVSGLEILRELYKVMPEQVSLVSFNYEDDNQLILRGQAQELNIIFSFAAELGRSDIFKKFNVKVRYATQKKVQGSLGVVDFEIICVYKK